MGPVATSQTYTITDDDITGGPTARVSYADGFLADESLESVPASVRQAAMAAAQ